MTSFIMDPASIIAYFFKSMYQWQVSFINLSLFFVPLFFLEGGGGGGGVEVYNRCNGEEQSRDTGDIQAANIGHIIMFY